MRQFRPHNRDATNQTGGACEFNATAPALPEANIQAEFYHYCRLLGVNCVLEYSTPFGRLDVAVMSADCSRLIAIVECKNQNRTQIQITGQIRRYKEIGVPVFGLCKFKRAQRLVEQIKRQFCGAETDGCGVLLTDVQSMVRPRLRFRRRGAFSPLDLPCELNYKDA